MLLCTSCTEKKTDGVHSTRPLDKVLEMIKINESKKDIIPVERIEITNKPYEENEAFGKYVIIHPDDEGKAQYQINYEIYPKNATTDTVYYSIEAKPAACATIDKETGLVTFSEAGMAKVFVIADDGSVAQDTITLICKN